MKTNEFDFLWFLLTNNKQLFMVKVATPQNFMRKNLEQKFSISGNCSL